MISEQITRYHEKKKRDILSFVKNGVVDWGRWYRLRGSDNGSSYNDEVRAGVINHLLDIGILSFNPERNYRVVGGGVDLNPRYNVCPTYFTNREQAQDYANALFSMSLHEVRIERLGDIEKIR